jgi:hypothetical protein
MGEELRAGLPFSFSSANLSKPSERPSNFGLPVLIIPAPRKGSDVVASQPLTKRPEANQLILTKVKAEPGTSASSAAADLDVEPRPLTIVEDDDEGQHFSALEDCSTLDYVINEDGSCTCKLCGEKVASRTHWYRHKYKVKTWQKKVD